MGCLFAKPEITNGVKYDKNHRKRKMFSFGIGIERGDLTINAHTQIGYVSATVKKYVKINDENSNITETNVDESGVLPTHPDNG
jgi:predicted HNH restriction endonuclease